MLVEEKGMKQLSDPAAIKAMIEDVLTANPGLVDDYRNGKSRAVGFIVGQVMKASKGRGESSFDQSAGGRSFKSENVK